MEKEYIMKKTLRLAAIVLLMILASAFPSLAENQPSWMMDQTTGKWYFIQPDGTAFKNGWLKLGELWYCFDADGVLYVNTTTPDGYVVDANGAWVDPSTSGSRVAYTLQMMRNKPEVVIGGVQDFWINVTSGTTEFKALEWSMDKEGIAAWVTPPTSADTRVQVTGLNVGTVEITARFIDSNGEKQRRSGKCVVVDTIGDGWFQANNGRWMYYEQGQPIRNEWRESNGKQFFIGEDGYMVQ